MLIQCQMPNPLHAHTSLFRNPLLVWHQTCCVTAGVAEGSVHLSAPNRMLSPDLSKVQDDEVGDGTTSVAVLAGELLREAELLVNAKIHPMTIVDGFRRSCAVAVEALEARAFDNAADPAALREDLLAIARTTLSSKILTHDKDHFSKIAVDAVMCLKGRTNLEPIQIIKKVGATMRDSFLAEVRYNALHVLGLPQSHMPSALLPELVHSLADNANANMGSV